MGLGNGGLEGLGGQAIDAHAATPAKPAEIPNELSVMTDNLEQLEQAIKELIAKLEPVSWKEPTTTTASDKCLEPSLPEPRCEISARLNAHNTRITACVSDITFIRKHIEL